MRRGFVLAAATLVGGLLAAPTVDSAPRPRFTVSIEGTQRFEWTLDATRDSRGGPVPCGYRGSGRQVITFRTARPVTVVVPRGEGSTYTYGGQPFFPVAPGPRKRLIPLVGQESRTYQALQAPAAGTCQNVPREQRKYFTDCGGTNPFLPNAGVVVMRYKRPRGHSQSVLARAGWKPGEREKAMMYAPVDVLLFERQPAQCGLLLFDVRNTYISQLLTVGQYRTLAGGPFERRRTNVLHSSGVVRGCVDPFGSTETGAVFQSCERPMRPGSVTGEITTTWKLTFRRPAERGAATKVQRVGKASDWLREERRKTLGDWVAVCVRCGHAQRYFEEFESELPEVCPQCAGDMRSRCPTCEARFSSAFAVECEACGGGLRPPASLGVRIRRSR